MLRKKKQLQVKKVDQRLCKGGETGVEGGASQLLLPWTAPQGNGELTLEYIAKPSTQKIMA